MIADRILIVDDEEKIRKIFVRLLSDEGFITKDAESGERALRMLQTFQPHIILLDQNLPGLDGIETMVRIKEKMPDTVVIIATAYGAVSMAVDAIKKGAYDYLEKPVDNNKLLLLLRRAAEHFKMNYEIRHLKDRLTLKNNFDGIIAESNSMKQIIEQAKCVCETDATVLLTGESGVGKEVIANAIHYSSRRRNKPIIAINCGAIPLTLIESELFGYEKGAFTDARETKPGKFEQADGGTVFLDEIAELPPDAQVKLLRVLEERRVNRLGGKKSIPVDVRIISATNKNLEAKVQQGTFRLDLLYRLNVFTISIPPLRERKEDIPMLIDTFIAKYNEQLNLNITNVTEKSMEMLIHYDWPGNIRDLQNALQSAMLLAKSGIIGSDHLPLRVKGYEKNEPLTDTEESLDKHIRQQSGRLERDLILEALKKCNYNRSATAELLKISRKTLFNKMRKYEI
jgi:DNA-binding NtrC family response regulator